MRGYSAESEVRMQLRERIPVIRGLVFWKKAGRFCVKGVKVNI